MDTQKETDHKFQETDSEIQEMARVENSMGGQRGLFLAYQVAPACGTGIQRARHPGADGQPAGEETAGRRHAGN
mgnify:CR=1 FL=1